MICVQFFYTGDPGILIFYSSDDNIHRMLALPGIANIPNLQQGD